MVSGTFDKGGRTFVSGQSVEAFWAAISHFPLLSIGMNCALGPDIMRPHLEELAKLVPCRFLVTRTLVFPMKWGSLICHRPRWPTTSRILRKKAGSTLLVVVVERPQNTFMPSLKGSRFSTSKGCRSCCLDTTKRSITCQLKPETPFTMIGERTNVTGSRAFAKLIRNGQFDEAVKSLVNK